MPAPTTVKGKQPVTKKEPVPEPVNVMEIRCIIEKRVNDPLIEEFLQTFLWHRNHPAQTT